MELVCSSPAWLRRKQIKETEVAVCIEVSCNQLVLALVECLITVEGSFFFSGKVIYANRLVSGRLPKSKN